MEVYIDKQFLINLFKLKLSLKEDPIIDDVINFLSRLSSVELFTNISLIEFKENIIFQKLTNLGERVPRIILNLCEKIEKGELIGNSSYKLFFIESRKAHTRIRQAGYLNFNTLTIRLEWKKFSLRQDDFEIPISETFSKILINWNFLKKYAHPTRSIIITDRYMFKSISCVQQNLIPLLISLLEGSPKVKVIIVLVGLFRDRINSFPIQEIYNLIMKSISKYCTASLYLVDAKFPVHFRSIISSYWYINIDCSLDFVEEGKLRKRADGHIYHGFIFRPSKAVLIKTALSKLEQRLDGEFVNYFDPISDQPVKFTYRNSSLGVIFH